MGLISSKRGADVRASSSDTGGKGGIEADTHHADADEEVLDGLRRRHIGIGTDIGQDNLEIPKAHGVSAELNAVVLGHGHLVVEGLGGFPQTPLPCGTASSAAMAE